ncbi:hypothetical protein A9Q96_00525 [Rhodobacterales bacterium 52_120_T64]|nr:hypothetical protein A9Q96_00525 [Rhodobacterales bacterium 52_120_T64]
MENLNISKTIDTLSLRREDWENDTLKKSNDVLYQLLDDCLNLFNEVKGNTKLVKALNADLKARGISYNSGASLATRIARAVFGKDCENRAYAYARVITVALEENDKNLNMHDFITAQGGIEEIRRKTPDGKSSKDVREARQELATEEFETSKAIALHIKVNNSKREHNDAAEHNLFVAIMREEDDGNYSMVYETSTESVINTALAEAGKVLEKQTNTKPVANTPKPTVGNVRPIEPKFAANETAVNKYIDKTAAQAVASPS